jgi:hypothetical protein
MRDDQFNPGQSPSTNPFAQISQRPKVRVASANLACPTFPATPESVTGLAENFIQKVLHPNRRSINKVSYPMPQHLFLTELSTLFSNLLRFLR